MTEAHDEYERAQLDGIAHLKAIAKEQASARKRDALAMTTRPLPACPDPAADQIALLHAEIHGQVA